MISKARTLALLLACIAAIGAISAAAAQAGTFTAEAYPATMTGEAVANHQFRFGAGTVNCPVATFHGQLVEASSTLTIGAEYNECTTAGGAAVVVNMTSCDYRFHAGETIEQDKVDGSMDVQCTEAGDEIDFMIPANGCTVKIPAQEGLTTLVFTDHTQAKDFDVDIGATEIEYTQNAQCAGGAGVFQQGEYSGRSTIQGDHAGAETGVTVD
jgi:hypothetical protein